MLDRTRAVLTASAMSLAIASGFAVSAHAAVNANMSKGDAQDACATLTKQFDYLAPTKKGLPYWNEAHSEFQTGKKACDGGNPVKGATAMKQSIRDMYVIPDTDRKNDNG
ncbi:hypothetical protein FHS78_002492 [Parvibaculum indicum]|uniref:hypothetical protein n=1 Tax=Parvibaculum indicum TaxID=562969 RepID=UPI001420C21D|nr:hypothetical protein [Parvibaculum indicum]NIJ42199.1 hypothetical protein [Parvibaculum indicum]